MDLDGEMDKMEQYGSKWNKPQKENLCHSHETNEICRMSRLVNAGRSLISFFAFGNKIVKSIKCQ